VCVCVCVCVCVVVGVGVLVQSHAFFSKQSDDQECHIWMNMSCLLPSNFGKSFLRLHVYMWVPMGSGVRYMYVYIHRGFQPAGATDGFAYPITCNIIFCWNIRFTVLFP